MWLLEWLEDQQSKFDQWISLHFGLEERKKATLADRVIEDAARDYRQSLKAIARTLSQGAEPHKDDKALLCKAFRILSYFDHHVDLYQTNVTIREDAGLAQLSVHLDWEKGIVTLQWRREAECTRDYQLGFIA